jgi:UDP-2,3-diacylglucosamine hydrolase
LENIKLEAGKKIYFASDFHLGIPDYKSSLDREVKLVAWLEEIRKDAAQIYIMGDLFDFWFEYKNVVPKGYARLFGKLAEITDSGLPVYFFLGNHDIWAFNYLEEEIGLVLHRKPLLRKINEKTFFLAHGDGLGPGDKGYKFLKKVFECRFNQWLFKWLHPDIGAKLGLYFSRRSRISNVIKEGEEKNTVLLENEMLFRFAKTEAAKNPEINYFVFGHRHIPLIENVSTNAKMIVLGDWITKFTYGVFDGNEFEISTYSPDNTN